MYTFYRVATFSSRFSGEACRTFLLVLMQQTKLGSIFVWNLQKDSLRSCVEASVNCKAYVVCRIVELQNLYVDKNSAFCIGENKV